MRGALLLASLILSLTLFIPSAKADLVKDVIKTSRGDLTLTFVGHGSLVFEYRKKVIHIDPFGETSNYSFLPKADVILITHDHSDHLDAKTIAEISTKKTKLILNRASAEKYGSGLVMKNGDIMKIRGFRIEATPAYNLIHMRRAGEPFHPEGNGNGYIITFGDTRVYVAGDTENVPEVKTLDDIDIAFLPMNMPYTMTAEMLVDLAKAIKPKILYPYHYGRADVSKVVDLLKDTDGIEVRIR